MTSPLDHVTALAEAIAAAGIDALELTGPAGRVRLRGAGAVRPSVDPDSSALSGPEAAAGEVVTSPGVGHFLRAHPLHDEPLVEIEDPVTSGQIVAFLRVGTLLLPVTAPRNGIVREFLAKSGTLVGFDDPLLVLWLPN